MKPEIKAAAKQSHEKFGKAYQMMADGWTKHTGTEMPTPDMIEAAAKRLVRWEDGCTWPDSWSWYQVVAARQDAERALRSGLAVMPDPKGEAIAKALADYARGEDIHEIMKELKNVERDHT